MSEAKSGIEQARSKPYYPIKIIELNSTAGDSIEAVSTHFNTDAQTNEIVIRIVRNGTSEEQVIAHPQTGEGIVIINTTSSGQELIIVGGQIEEDQATGNIKSITINGLPEPVRPPVNQPPYTFEQLRLNFADNRLIQASDEVWNGIAWYPFGAHRALIPQGEYPISYARIDNKGGIKTGGFDSHIEYGLNSQLYLQAKQRLTRVCPMAASGRIGVSRRPFVTQDGKTPIQIPVIRSIQQ